MSRVNKIEKKTSEKTQKESISQALSTEVNGDDSQVAATHSRRIVLSCTATSEELKAGIEVGLTNGSDVFKPDFDQTQLDDQAKASMAKLDTTRGIVTGIKLVSVFSNCPDSVSLGMNLYKNQPSIVNESGHLFVETTSDLGSSHANTMDGFVALANVLPYERSRGVTPVYTPSNLMSSRFVSAYGGHTLESLWTGVVSFPGEDYYYVGKDHVILRIIKQNWEMLGMNLDAEKQREGQYLKVSKDVVNNVIDQLYQSVICNIPYTDFSNLKARFQSNNPEEGDYKVVTELLVSYKYPTIANSTTSEEID
jgi:hypothetical protein